MKEKGAPVLSERDKLLIMGAGPCGLGAASELQDEGVDNWTLVEKHTSAGGLASSLTSAEGFIFDIGGHVLFSHYEKFDRMCERVCSEWLELERNAYIFMRNRFVPYPLQHNFGHLPAEEVDECLAGLNRVVRSKQQIPTNFEEWLRYSFGDGLYRIFMEPYNFKVWGYPPSDLDSQWVGERVARIDETRLNDIVNRKEKKGWGPNATFKYPKYGGTGVIWLSLASELDQEHIKYGVRVKSIDAAEKEVYLSDGTVQRYDFLVSTIPLDSLCRITNRTGEPGLSRLAESFKHSSLHIIGVGMEGQPPEHLKNKGWIYFPEPNVPFYRATVLSNYSPYVVPQPGNQWSLLLEISESDKKPMNAGLLERTIESCQTIGLIPAKTKILSRILRTFEYGYPTPFLGRDGVITMAINVLQEHNIFSRGRFGGWKYEVSNQDHSYMQGVEVVRSLLLGEKEVTFPSPHIVNQYS